MSDPKPLSELREEAGLSQEGLARRVGARSVKTIARIEAKDSTGDPATRLLVAQALGVTEDEIRWPTDAEVEARKKAREQKKEQPNDER